MPVPRKVRIESASPVNAPAKSQPALRIVSQKTISPALKDVIDSCLVPILIKRYLVDV